jgi:diguanylate cyclase (GGDEF)-like protein/PAS domain S-box-containing protein
MLRIRQSLSIWISLLSRSSVFYLALFLVPLFWLTFLVASSLEKARALKISESQANNSLSIYQAHIDSIFLDVDRSLLLLRLLYEKDPGHFDLKYWTHSAALTSATVTAFIAAGADGFMVAASNYSGPPLYFGDRNDFVAIKNRTDDILQISAVQSGRISGDAVIKVTRRLQDRDGRFAGVITASIDPNAIVKFFDMAQLGIHGTVSLRTSDRVILAVRGLPSSSIGQTVSAPQLEQGLAKGSSGFYWGGGAIDGVSRLIAFRKSENVPLILVAAIGEDDVFASYSRQRTIYFGVATLLSLILIATAAWDIGRVSRLDKAQRAIEEMVERFKSATENMPYALSMFGKDQRLVACNSKYQQLYNLPPDVLHAGCSFQEFIERLVAAGIVAGNAQDYVDKMRVRLPSDAHVQSLDVIIAGRTIQITSRFKDDGGWVSTHMDVTDSRNAEKELLRVKNFLDTIIQNLPMPIVIKDAWSRKVLLINRAYSRLHGVSADAIVGATMADVFPADLAQRIAADDDKAMQSDNGTTSVEFNVETPEFGGRVILANRFVVRDTDGRPEFLISLVEDATDRKNNEARINQLAHYDPLTGLMNRALFREQLEGIFARQRRDGSPFAIFMVDLDRFKHVNDAYGHHSGDVLLKAVAKRLRDSIREGDLAARLGGDEFALIVRSGQDDFKAGCERLASRLIDVVGRPFELEERQVTVGCSIGIALPSAPGERSDELLRGADLALYKAKNSGRNCFQLYSDELKAEADQRNALENDLRQAIWREEFELFYQPVVSADNGRVAVVEALLRWRHPTRGLVMPNEFIPLAEESSLIVRLGEWVMARACRDAKTMPDDVRVAINISPVQFSKSNVVDAVIFALVDADLAPERLEIEITEGVLLSDSEQNLQALRQLHNIGVSIALDDFGVGYSSLSYLTSFPFDKVKIDKSFVGKSDRREANAIIESVVQLAKSLNLKVCAEGIESEVQGSDMRGLGLDLCQGYLFGRPMPLQELNFDRGYEFGERNVA